MSTAHLFEDFGPLEPASAPTADKDAEEIEDLKLQAFENGYQAGWDDAVKAQSDTTTHVSSGLAASLQSASFEYHEVRSALNSSVQTIMEQVIMVILPTIAQASLGAHIRQHIEQAVQRAVDRNIEIVVAPEAEDAVRNLISGELPEPFSIIADPLMSSTQTILRIGSDETEINFHKVIDDINAAVTSFFATDMSEVTDARSS